MSILVHQCQQCGHFQSWHTHDRFTSCACCSTTHANKVAVHPEPVLVDTWRLDDPTRTPEPLYEPGTDWNAGTSHRVRLCDCDVCCAAYADATS